MNPYLILMALLLSSLSFVVLTLLETLLGSRLDIQQVSAAPDSSATDFSHKGILKSLLLKYVLDFLVPLAVLVTLFHFLPFKGVRFAIFFALLLFVLNVSQLLLLAFQGIKLSFDSMIFVLFWKLLKYLPGFAIAGFVLGL